MLLSGAEKEFLRYSTVDVSRGLPAQSWKDGENNLLEQASGRITVVEVQGYAYLALLAASDLSGRLGKKSAAQELLGLASALKQRFNAAFWLEDVAFPCLALDDNNQQVNALTSNGGQLLFTGIVEKKHARFIVEKLFSPAFWTPYGIRTLATTEPAFVVKSYQNGSVWPHDTWIIAQGLKQMGWMQEYHYVCAALLRAYYQLQRPPEYYCVSEGGELLDPGECSPRPCIPQAWSVGAFLECQAALSSKAYR